MEKSRHGWRLTDVTGHGCSLSIARQARREEAALRRFGRRAIGLLEDYVFTPYRSFDCQYSASVTVYISSTSSTSKRWTHTPKGGLRPPGHVNGRARSLDSQHAAGGARVGVGAIGTDKWYGVRAAGDSEARFLASNQNHDRCEDPHPTRQSPVRADLALLLPALADALQAVP